MKKKFLVTLTPPKLTKQLKEEIEKDVPIVSQKLWGKRKAYKYNSYIKAKVEKGYLILSIFKTEFVRLGSNIQRMLFILIESLKNIYHLKLR